MKADSARVILGFYSSEHVDAEKAYLAIGGSAGRKVRLFSGNGTGNGTKRHGGAEARYSALRLEGESLVLAETPLPKVQAVVKELQSVGLPAVFVLGEDFANLRRAPSFQRLRNRRSARGFI